MTLLDEYNEVLLQTAACMVSKYENGEAFEFESALGCADILDSLYLSFKGSVVKFSR